jgi:uncharacterized membrane protein (UPF0127 family)
VGSVDATVLGRKNLYRLVFVVILLLVSGGVFVISKTLQAPSADRRASQLLGDKIIGRIGQGYFNFEVADTSIERERGLSGRSPLADTDAMLFVFEQPDKHCFWMKDMKFSIDILWFDADKKLVYEKRGATPESYPENFCSDVPAKYTVEVTTGVAEKNQLKIGDKLDIEL